MCLFLLSGLGKCRHDDTDRAEGEAGRKDFVALHHSQLVSPAEGRTVVFLLQRSFYCREGQSRKRERQARWWVGVATCLPRGDGRLKSRTSLGFLKGKKPSSSGHRSQVGAKL